MGNPTHITSNYKLLALTLHLQPNPKLLNLHQNSSQYFPLCLNFVSDLNYTTHSCTIETITNAHHLQKTSNINSNVFAIKFPLLLVSSNTKKKVLQNKIATAFCSILHFNLLCNSLHTWFCMLLPMEIAYRPLILTTQYFSLVSIAFAVRQLQFYNQNTISVTFLQPSA